MYLALGILRQSQAFSRLSLFLVGRLRRPCATAQVTQTVRQFLENICQIENQFLQPLN